MTRPIHEIARDVLTYARSWEPAARLVGNATAAEVERLAEAVSVGNVTQTRAILEGLLLDIEAASAFQGRAGGQQCAPPLLTSMQPSVRVHVSLVIRHALAALTSSPWRPIEECGELEEGEYLVAYGPDNDDAELRWWDGAQWMDHSCRILTEPPVYVHQLGPIRGPGEG